jgi:hypothetical protein
MMEVLEVMANKKLIVSLMDPSTYPPSDIGQQIAILSTRCESPAISVMSNSNASTNLPSVFDIADEVGTHLQFPYVTSTKTPSIDGRCSVNSVASSQADYFDAGMQIMNLDFSNNS